MTVIYGRIAASFKGSYCRIDVIGTLGPLTLMLVITSWLMDAEVAVNWLKFATGELIESIGDGGVKASDRFLSQNPCGVCCLRFCAKFSDGIFTSPHFLFFISQQLR